MRLINIISLFLFVLVASFAQAREKLAIVFAGPTIDSDSSAALSAIARNHGYRVHYVHPGESTTRLLKNADVYIVPGGEDIEAASEGWTPQDRAAIQVFVHGGGKYWGVCLGGYWAGKEGTWPGTQPYFRGLDLLPAVVSNHSDTPEDRIEPVRWHDGTRHAGYFQDGPEFALKDAVANNPLVKIFGYYDDESVAAFIAPVGRGKLAVSGVHWEASPDWYLHIEDRLHPGTYYDLIDPDPSHTQLANEMFIELMRGP